MRTSDEALQRMERLTERMAERFKAAQTNCDFHATAREDYEDAYTLSQIKEPPIDPDLKIAQQICDRAGFWSTAVRDAVLAGLKYGRAMGAFDAPQSAEAIDLRAHGCRPL